MTEPVSGAAGATDREPARATTLHLLCGKIAAGKSTLARRLERDEVRLNRLGIPKSASF
jgi:hypothetical protein